MRWCLLVVLMGCGLPSDRNKEPPFDATKWIHISPEELSEPLEDGIYEVTTYIEQPGCGLLYGPGERETWRLWGQNGSRYLSPIGGSHCAMVSVVAKAIEGQPNRYVHRTTRDVAGCTHSYTTQIRLRKHFPYKFQGDWGRLVDSDCLSEGASCHYIMKVSGSGE